MSNNQVRVSQDKLIDIADAIREKLNNSDTYTLDEMPTAINSISGGGQIKSPAIIEDMTIIIPDFILITEDNILEEE